MQIASVANQLCREMHLMQIASVANQLCREMHPKIYVLILLVRASRRGRCRGGVAVGANNGDPGADFDIVGSAARQVNGVMPGIEFLAVLEFVERNFEAISFHRILGCCTGLLRTVLPVRRSYARYDDHEEQSNDEHCFSHIGTFPSSILLICLPALASWPELLFRMLPAPARPDLRQTESCGRIVQAPILLHPTAGATEKHRVWD